MKRQIRRGVFETNSSSMHSLVIKKDCEYFTYEEVKKDIYIDGDGHIMVWRDDNSFGRSPFNVLGSLIKKAFYVIASMCEYKGDDVYNEVCDVIRSYLPEFKDFDIDYLGYVDEDILTPFLKEEGITITEFIKNKRYVVIVDGDEYRVYDHMKQYGIIDTGNIEREYPNREFV